LICGRLGSSRRRFDTIAAWTVRSLLSAQRHLPCPGVSPADRSHSDSGDGCDHRPAPCSEHAHRLSHAVPSHRFHPAWQPTRRRMKGLSSPSYPPSPNREDHIARQCVSASAGIVAYPLYSAARGSQSSPASIISRVGSPSTASTFSSPDRCSWLSAQPSSPASRHRSWSLVLDRVTGLPFGRLPYGHRRFRPSGRALLRVPALRASIGYRGSCRDNL
jgi:hypothetical protein